MQWRRHLRMVLACSAAALLPAILGRGVHASGDEPASRPDPKAGIEQINVIEAEKPARSSSSRGAAARTRSASRSITKPTGG